MTDDDPGILGNLPRSRPGTRSDKRGGKPGEKKAAVTPAKASSTSKPKAAAKPKAGAKPRAAAKPKPAAKPRATAKPKAAGQPQATRKAPTPPLAREADASGSDPVGDIARAGEALARSGIRVGSAIAVEALRRLTGR